MRLTHIAVLIVLATGARAGSLPPQARANHVGGQDCGVIATVLDAYLIRAREAGRSWGFTGLHFFVLTDADSKHPSEISSASSNLDQGSRETLERLLSQPIRGSLLERAVTSDSLYLCNLSGSFAFAHAKEDVQLDTPHEAFLYEMFPEFDGILSIALPGYSTNECEALVSLYAEFPIWEEHLVYYLVSDGKSWRVQRMFQVYLQGE